MQDTALLEKQVISSSFSDREIRITKQHAAGKLTAKERLNLLFDQDSFEEYGKFAQGDCIDFGMDKKNVPGDGVITGSGKIDGKTVFAYSQDFTVLGGSLGKKAAEKICNVMDIAGRVGAPFVGINDSGGARIQEGVDSLGGYGEIFQRNVNFSGVIPQISMIMGPCAGGAVYSPALTDFTFMVNSSSYMFVTGPDVIKKVTFEDISQNDLGGSDVHTKKTGVADASFANDIKALCEIRRLISFLPSNNRSGLTHRSFNQDSVTRRENALSTIVPDNPNIPYDMKKVINLLVDNGDFFELQDNFAKNIITGFCRMGGYTVGVIANQPINLAGCLDIDASCKAARFIRFCDAFNIPLLTLIDVPGFLPGSNQEHNGIIRHGAKLLYAYAEATVPKISVIVRKAYGGAYIVMNSRHLRGDFNFSWPGCEIAVMGAEGAIEIIYRKYKDDKEAIAKLTNLYKEKFSNPYFAASKGYIDDVIDPTETRSILCRSFELLRDKKVDRPWRKHDNLPL